MIYKRKPSPGNARRVRHINKNIFGWGDDLSNRPTITSLLGRTVTRRSSTNSDNLFVDDPLGGAADL